MAIDNNNKETIEIFKKYYGKKDGIGKLSKHFNVKEQTITTHADVILGKRKRKRKRKGKGKEKEKIDTTSNKYAVTESIDIKSYSIFFMNLYVFTSIDFEIVPWSDSKSALINSDTTKLIEYEIPKREYYIEFKDPVSLNNIQRIQIAGEKGNIISNIFKINKTIADNQSINKITQLINCPTTTTTTTTNGTSRMSISDDGKEATTTLSFNMYENEKVTYDLINTFITEFKFKISNLFGTLSITKPPISHTHTFTNPVEKLFKTFRLESSIILVFNKKPIQPEHNFSLFQEKK
ncbi:hypothetical protein ACTFIW_009272 [Dictyostelium discoideum]